MPKLVYLKEYKGSEQELIIQSTYVLDGKELKTDLSGFMVGLFQKTVKEVFIPEGIEEFPARIFNSCSVVKFYLPHSLKHFSPYTLGYFHDKGIKVFYAGTQAEFEALLMEDSEAVNPYIGNNFDASLFEFIFEATPEDYFSGLY